MKRIGVVGIVLNRNKEISIELQKVLNEFSDIIIGRIGIPRGDISAISVIVEGSNEKISALTGRLGKFDEVYVKSALTTFEVD